MGSVFTKENLFGGKAPKPETRSSGLGIGSGAVAPSVHKVTVSSHDQTILDLKNQRRRLKAQCKRVCLATFARPTQALGILVWSRCNRLFRFLTTACAR